MSDDDAIIPRPVSGEIIPRQRSDVQFPPNMPAGIPLLARAKYWAARKSLESYVKALQAQEQAFRALEARAKAQEAYERTLVRAERLDDIRRIEELAIERELSQLEDEAELRSLRMRSMKAGLEADAIGAERRLESIKNQKESDQAGLSSGAKAAADIRDFRKDAESLKKALVDVYGNEDQLSEEDRNLFAQVDEAVRNKIVDRLENL